MAFEQLNGMSPYTLVAASTGLAQYRFCTVSSTGGAAYPAVGQPVVGVLRSGSTGSTRDGTACEVYPPGTIAKVAAVSSTLSAGDSCIATSVGYADVAGAGEYAVGKVIKGSSGGTGRILSVLLTNIGTT